MNLTCSAKVIKYLLFGFNLFFVITGIIILALGVSVKAYYYEYDTFLDEQYFSLPNLLIATGCIIFFISVFGCCGAYKENGWMIYAFSGLLILTFILEFSAGIAGYVLRDQTASYLEMKLNESMFKYKSNQEIAKMWDIIQKQFECCGVKNYKDWSKPFGNDNQSLPVSCCPFVYSTVGEFYCNANFSNVPTKATTATTISTTVKTASPSSDNTSVSSTTETSTSLVTKSKEPITIGPVVSSKAFYMTDSYPNTTSKPYLLGCEEGFGNFIKRHAVDIGGVGIALAVMQLLGIVFSCHLARQLKNGYYST